MIIANPNRVQLNSFARLLAEETELPKTVLSPQAVRVAWDKVQVPLDISTHDKIVDDIDWTDHEAVGTVAAMRLQNAVNAETTGIDLGLPRNTRSLER